jgi:hypothetical protein
VRLQLAALRPLSSLDCHSPRTYYEESVTTGDRAS